MKRSKDIGSFFQIKKNKTSVEAEATEENVRQQRKRKNCHWNRISQQGINRPERQ